MTCAERGRLLLQVNKKLEEVLTSKDSIIRTLQYDVAKVRLPAAQPLSSRPLPPLVLPGCTTHWTARGLRRCTPPSLPVKG